MVFRQSDLFIVVMKPSNVGGAKGQAILRKGEEKQMLTQRGEVN